MGGDTEKVNYLILFEGKKIIKEKKKHSKSISCREKRRSIEFS